MSKRCALAAVASISCALAALPAAAQNLLTNPGFTNSLNGWLVDGSTPSVYSAVWNSLDAAGSGGSGSVRVTNQFASAVAATTPIVQCVPVVGGSEYTAAVQLYLPAGQSRTGFGSALIYWYTAANCASGASFGAEFDISTVGVWLTAGGNLTAPAGAHSARLGIALEKTESGGSLQLHADNARFQLASTATCTPSSTTLCIDKAPGDRRFRATVHFETSQGGGIEGDGHAVDLDALGIHQGGVFWFFNAGNPELLIKVLDGCAVNGKYWVFFSAGTNVGLSVDVIDTVTGEAFHSSNADLHPAAPVQATNALPCS